MQHIYVAKTSHPSETCRYLKKERQKIKTRIDPVARMSCSKATFSKAQVCKWDGVMG